MKASSTSDVSLDTLRGLQRGWHGLVPLEVDEQQTFFKALEAPSWVAFLDQPSGWVSILGPSAAIFCAEILKEAAKETWRNKGRAAAALRRTGVSALERFAPGLADLKAQLDASSRLQLGYPIPDDYFGTKLELEGSSVEEMATQVALFVIHAQGLQDLLSTIRAEDTVTGQITVKLLEDGSMRVTWIDQENLDIHEATLPPPDVA